MRVSAYEILYLKFLMWDIFENVMPIKRKTQKQNINKWINNQNNNKSFLGSTKIYIHIYHIYLYTHTIYILFE